MLVAFLPLVAALVWAAVRLRRVMSTLVIAVAMAAATFALWWLVLLFALLVAGLSCPDDAFECPI